jgi:hypothetical protein
MKNIYMYLLYLGSPTKKVKYTGNAESTTGTFPISI